MSEYPFAGPIVPVLRVEDADASAAFYGDLLGFQIAEERNEDGILTGARLRAGEAQLILSQQRGEVQTSPGAGPVFRIQARDVEGLHASLVAKGVTIAEIRRTETGSIEFELVDPDGYELWFGGADSVTGPAPAS